MTGAFFVATARSSQNGYIPLLVSDDLGTWTNLGDTIDFSSVSTVAVWAPEFFRDPLTGTVHCYAACGTGGAFPTNFQYMSRTPPTAN